MESTGSVAYETREHVEAQLKATAQLRNVTAAQTREASPVESELQRVQRGLSEAFGRLELLTDRLKPVLVAEDEEPSPALARYGDSPLVQEISALAGGVEYLAERIRKVMERLTV